MNNTLKQIYGRNAAVLLVPVESDRDQVMDNVAACIERLSMLSDLSGIAVPTQDYAETLLNQRIRGVRREKVYNSIDTERDYQDAGRGNAKRHEDQPAVMTPGEYLLCMEECLTEARKLWYKPDGSKTCLEFVRKIAALGVACMEHHGAPARA